MFQYTEEKPTPRLSSMSRSFRTWPHASTKALRMSRVQSFFKVKAARLVKEEREVASWIAEGPFIGTQPPCVIIISLKTAICYSWTIPFLSCITMIMIIFIICSDIHHNHNEAGQGGDPCLLMAALLKTLLLPSHHHRYHQYLHHCDDYHL